jgi:hypothetical protein
MPFRALEEPTIGFEGVPVEFASLELFDATASWYVTGLEACHVSFNTHG